MAFGRCNRERDDTVHADRQVVLRDAVRLEQLLEVRLDDLLSHHRRRPQQPQALRLPGGALLWAQLQLDAGAWHGPVAPATTRPARAHPAVAPGAAPDALAQLDGVAVVGFTIDAPGALSQLPFPRLKNPPAAFAKSVGADTTFEIYTHMGGNSPQQVINTLCERIARGENELTIAVGAEFLGSLMKRLKSGAGFAGWEDPYAIEDEPRRMGDPRPGTTPQENAHGLNRPINVYPMFENALRARDGRSIDDHQKRLGKLFAPFSKVASMNPHAWFPTERSEAELVTVTVPEPVAESPEPAQAVRSKGATTGTIRERRIIVR